MNEIPIRKKLLLFLVLIATTSLLLFILPLIESALWSYIGDSYGVSLNPDGTLARTHDALPSELFGLTFASLVASLFKVLRIVFWMTMVILAVRLLWFVIFTTALRAAAQSEIASLVKTVLSIVVYIVSFFVIFQTQYPNVPLAPLFTGSTIIGIVVGLALQDTLGNLFAGIALQADQPFQVGDIVSISNRGMGTVESVTWRGVKIRTFQNRLLVISNSVLGKETIEVAPRDNLNARVVTFNTLYSDFPVKTINVVRSAIADIDNVARRPRPIVRIGGFGESGIDWEIKYWCENFKRHPETDAAIRQRIWYAFNREGINFAFPTRTVHIERQRSQPTSAETTNAVAEDLRSIDLFSSLSEKEIGRIAAKANVSVYAPGESIVVQGDDGDSMFLISSGSVSIQLKDVRSDRLSKIGELGPGDFFGEMSLLTGEVRSASVVAEEETEVIEVDKDALRPVFQSNPEILVSISDAIEERKPMLEQPLHESMYGQTKADSKPIINALKRFFGLDGEK